MGSAFPPPQSGTGQHHTRNVRGQRWHYVNHSRGNRLEEPFCFEVFLAVQNPVGRQSRKRRAKWKGSGADDACSSLKTRQVFAHNRQIWTYLKIIKNNYTGLPNISDASYYLCTKSSTKWASGCPLFYDFRNCTNRMSLSSHSNNCDGRLSSSLQGGLHLCQGTVYILSLAPQK